MAAGQKSISHDVFLDNKTPKMLVIERCAKLKIAPAVWHTEPLPSPTTSPKFRCTCSMEIKEGDEDVVVTAEAVGISKKEAEQRAAWEILPKIMSYQDLFEATYPGKMMKQVKVEREQVATKKCYVDVDEDPVSDTDDTAIIGEPIGALKTLCERQRERLAMPAYEEIQRRGNNNAVIFTVTCSVGTESSQKGRRLSKKDAKKLASFRVLRELKSKGYEMEKSKGSKGSKTFVVTNKQTSPTSSRKNDGKLNEEVSSTASSSKTDGAEESEEECDRPSGIILLKDYKEPSLTDSNSEEEAMKIDKFCESLKRKFENSEEDFLDAPDLKRFMRQPICPIKNDSCLKFVKDFSHVFLHFPISATIEKTLVSEEAEYLKILHDRGGPFKVLDEIALDLNIKISYSKPIELDGGTFKYCVFLKMNLPFEYKHEYQKGHSLYGEGHTVDEAKENASLEALQYIREMKLAVP